MSERWTDKHTHTNTHTQIQKNLSISALLGKEKNRWNASSGERGCRLGSFQSFCFFFYKERENAQTCRERKRLNPPAPRLPSTPWGSRVLASDPTQSVQGSERAAQTMPAFTVCFIMLGERLVVIDFFFFLVPTERMMLHGQFTRRLLEAPVRHSPHHTPVSSNQSPPPEACRPRSAFVPAQNFLEGRADWFLRSWGRTLSPLGVTGPATGLKDRPWRSAEFHGDRAVSAAAYVYGLTLLSLSPSPITEQCQEEKRNEGGKKTDLDP